MTRISAGDYLLPSNDGQTLWRIYRYTDEYVDGETGRDRRLKCWGTAKFRRPIETALDVDDLLDWEYWDHWATYLTRAEAVEAAATKVDA